MKEKAVRFLPVVSKDKKLLGVLTFSDFLDIPSRYDNKFTFDTKKVLQTEEGEGISMDDYSFIYNEEQAEKMRAAYAKLLDEAKKKA